jgi:RluA family pseudouridine synthase
MILSKTICAEDGGRRLDETVSSLFDAISKSEARRIIDRGGCRVNGAMVRVASRAVKGGDVIEVGFMDPGQFRDLVLPEGAVLYEDEGLIAVNKPSGANAQRTPYQLKGTLEYWVAERFRACGISEPVRVVHRLDRGTSGVMLFPKSKRSAAHLSLLFKNGDIAKRYLALVTGMPRLAKWCEEGPIGKLGTSRYGVVTGGKPSRTDFLVLAKGDGHALMEARPMTGRTHQIRVHLAAARLPIVGDATYGGEPAGRMMLHCAGLDFVSADGRPISIRAACDDAFAAAMERWQIRV